MKGGDRSAHCTARALLGVFWLTSYGYWAPERPTNNKQLRAPQSLVSATPHGDHCSLPPRQAHCG